MAKIKQYRPNFFSGFENETVEFATTEELLNVEFVKKFKRDGFSGFALSTYGEQTNLIATYKNGKKWWVVGFIDDVSNVNLSKWEAGKAPVEKLLRPTGDKQMESAAQIADTIEAACFPGSGEFIVPRKSWMREWVQQLRHLQAVG